SLQGATMISIPPHSAPGTHPVAIESPEGRSAIANFVVDGPAPPAVPRIDGVTLADTQFDGDDKVRVILYVQAANIDVCAKVLADAPDMPRTPQEALYDTAVGGDPRSLDFPIRHYLSRIIPLAARPRGANVTVEVFNEAGEASNQVSYTLPDDPKTF